jgi:long-subunit fatty acid transport protein
MRPRRVAAAAVAASLLGAGPAGAQAVQNVVLRNSFNPVGAGARGLGMGGAFIAVADDGTAASFNPAGLSQLRRSELALVGFTDKVRSTIEVPATPFSEASTRSSTAKHGAPDFAGLAVPFTAGSRNLTVQLAYQRAVDLFGRGSALVQNTLLFTDVGIDRPGTVDVVAEISPQQSGAFHTVSAAIGSSLSSRLSLGLSLNYWVAEWSAEGSTQFSLRSAPRPGARPVEFARTETDFQQDQSLRGFNLNAGFLLKYARVSVGGVVRLPFAGDYRLTETTSSRTFEMGQPPQPATIVEPFANTRLHWPRSAGLGIALRPLRGLTVAADYTKSHWSRTFIEDVPGGALLTEQQRTPDGEVQESFTDRNFFDLLPASQSATADTDQWRAGAEYLLVLPRVVVPLRAGILRDRSPVSELGSNEGRRIRGFTLGSGINFRRLVIDFAFERRESEGVVSLRFRRGAPVDEASPTETVSEDRIVASLIYRFGDNDPIKRALRYLFVGPEEKGQD